MKLDVFRFCRCLRYVGTVMLLVVFGLEAFLYHSVLTTYLRIIKESNSWVYIFLGLLVLISYTGLCVMLTWSYLATFLTSPGTVPSGWHPFQSTQEEQAVRQAVQDRPRTPTSSQFCYKCQSWRPARAHHCRVMGTCILKMDHYCLWVVNCVGLLNYKAFLLFLFYTTLALVETTVVLIPVVVQGFNQRLDTTSTELTQALISITFSCGFALALLAFLAMHWDMVRHNYTSVESFDYSSPDAWPYDRGLRRNMHEVFGRKWWFIPIHSEDDRQWLLAQALEVQAQPLVSSIPMVATDSADNMV